MNLTPIAQGDRSILACILRAAEFRNRENPNLAIGGVHIHGHGEHVRCAATTGAGMAVVHAWAGGIDIPEPMTITADSVKRAADLYRRIRPALHLYLARNDPAKGGAPMITASVELRSLDHGKRTMPLLHIRVPSLDDGTTLRGFPYGVAFPNYCQSCEPRKAFKIGFTPGVGFRADLIASAQRVLGPGNLIPYTGGRGTYFRNLSLEAADYVMLMPITMGDDQDHFLFGRPDEQSAT